MMEISYTIELETPRTGKDISEAVKELAEEQAARTWKMPLENMVI